MSAATEQQTCVHDSQETAITEYFDAVSKACSSEEATHSDIDRILAVFEDDACAVYPPMAAFGIRGK